MKSRNPKLYLDKETSEKVWIKKFAKRFEKITNSRKKENVLLLEQLIKDMKAMDFSENRIATLIGRDRSSVRFHLNK